MKGLDAYEKEIEQAAIEEKMSATDRTVRVDQSDHDYPVLAVPEKKSRFGSRQIPAYVKQGFPNILQTTQLGETYGRPGTSTGAGEGTGMFPKIPGAEENYGMVYNKPESAAEKAMHELWMARRRQEVKFCSVIVKCTAKLLKCALVFGIKKRFSISNVI